MIKSLLARLPHSLQQELKRLRFRRQIRAGSFAVGRLHDEPEFGQLGDWLKPGDMAIDIGANIGHYTVRLAQIVGPLGRVIALEPVPSCFELLSANVAAKGLANVTLVNAAMSDRAGLARMVVPRFSNGLENTYEARLDGASGDVSVLCLTGAALGFDERVTLVKIDAEGHEAAVLRGMRKLLERDLPVLIVEGGRAEVDDALAGLGYASRRIGKSHNKVYEATERGVAAAAAE